MARLYWPQPVLNLIVAKQPGESKSRYAKRFERALLRFGKLQALRDRLGH